VVIFTYLDEIFAVS